MHIAIGVHFYVPVSFGEIALILVAVALILWSRRALGRGASPLLVFVAILGVAFTGSAVFAVAVAGTVLLATRFGRVALSTRSPATDLGRECVLVLCGLVSYEVARMVIESDFARAYENALRVVEAERTAGLDVELQLQDWLTARRWQVVALNWIYSYAFLSLVACAIVWLYLTDRVNYRLLRNSLGLSSAIAIAVIAAFPVAPPRLVTELSITDTAVALGQEHRFANSYAAIPSLHVGWLSLSGFVIGRSSGSRRIALLALLPAVLMFVVVVATGNHYLVDGVVGTLVAVGSAIILTRPGVRNAFVGLGRGAWQFVGVLAVSSRARFSAVSLAGLLTFLAVGDLISPGFTAFWGYLLVQMAVTLVLLVAGEAAFRSQGGLTWQTHVLAVACGYADVLGTAGDLYANIDEYDKFTHFLGVAAITAAAFDCLAALHARTGDSRQNSRLVWIAVSVGMAAGIGWEVYEWLGDAVFRTKRIQSHFDTANDLIFDFLGAVTAGYVLRKWGRARLSGMRAAMFSEAGRG